MSESTTPCRGCGVRVLWVTTLAGKRMPLDPNPVATGNVALRPDLFGVPVAVYITRENPAQKGELLYLSHFATCSMADPFRRRNVS